MRTVRVARRYAKALMSAAEELRTLEATTADLDFIGSVVRGSREFRLFLGSPVVSVARKRSVIKEVFGGRISPSMMTFLELLIDKQRESLLSDIVDQFEVLRDAKLGIVNVAVTTAVDLAPPQIQALEKELERYTGAKIRLRFTRDGAIRGGMVVRIGDTVLDASLTRQLERLRERFARGSASLPN